MAFEIPITDGVPAFDELTALRQWVLFNKDKRPFNPATGLPASTTSPKTWGTFDEACRAGVKSGQFMGVGFVFTAGSGLVGIDLDKCVDGDGRALPWAQNIIDQINSYTEKSPSGKGFHIFIKGRLPGPRNKKAGVEMYATERYFTVTGHHVEGTPDSIEERQEELNSVYNEIFPSNGNHAIPAQELSEITVDLEASPPFKKFNALIQNDRKFRQTWDHQRKDLLRDGLPDMSSHDLSLAIFGVAHDWSDQEIANLIIAHRVESGREKDILKVQRVKYLEDTIKFARQAHSDGVTDTDAIATHSIRSARDTNNTNEQLNQVSHQIGVEVSRVIMRGRDPSEFYFVIDDEEIRIGNMDQVGRQSHVLARIAEITRRMPDRLQPPRWREYVNLILRVAEYEEALDPRTELFNAVQIYFTKRTVFPADEYQDALPSSHPFLTDDGKTWINLENFYGFVDRHKLIKGITYRDLQNRMTQVKFEKRKFDETIHDERVQRRYWGGIVGEWD